MDQIHPEPTMKKITLVVLLLSAFCLAASKPNTADYPITVHVIGSSLSSYGANCIHGLDVMVNGKHLQLSGGCDKTTEGSFGLTQPGDYKARFTADEHSPSFRLAQTYEILFPDNSKRKFTAIAISEQ